MTYTTVYDIANDSVGLQFPLIGLGLILVGAVMRWGFGKSGLASYPFIAIGILTVLASGALPLWDRNRVVQAVAKGEAKQIEGPIRNRRIVRVRGTRNGTSSRYSYIRYELFSVGDIDFDIEWNALEAGFANRGSTEEHPTVPLSNGMTARIWYLPIDGPGKPPRITRIDLRATGWAAATGQPDADAPTSAAMASALQNHIDDGAGILPAAQKAQTETRLDAFERMTGHQLVVVTIPSLGGKDIARYAADLANERGIGRQAKNDGILLLVAPNERQARIAVGRGLEAVLSDAASAEIMEMTIVPLFRRGDMPTGIDAGVAAIIGKVMREERR